MCALIVPDANSWLDDAKSGGAKNANGHLERCLALREEIDAGKLKRLSNGVQRRLEAPNSYVSPPASPTSDESRL
jgi:hypothetical protein